jgi:murein tripeptide amidase MpaA
VDEVQPRDYAVYTKYDELTAKLKELERQFPGLVKVESVGKTRQGREIWGATVTNLVTGPAEVKPAMYIDGNHHAGEVTGCATCLYVIAYLAHNYYVLPEVKWLLDTRALYVRPRVSPDGSELYLTTPYMLRSTPKPWPLERADDGITPEDIDGDGCVRQMRVRDDNGEFRISAKDDRLMVKRMSYEYGGEYYRVYTEGLVQGYDGIELHNARPKWGLDLNRNYPITWGGEVKQPGAGPYPLSEPETRSVAEFLDSHRNISAVISYHTTGGIILRPSTMVRDADMNAQDLAMYKAIGRRGTEVTGYPCASILEGLTGPRRPSLGALPALVYDHFGMLYFGVELWDLEKRAGIPHRDREARAQVTELDEEEDGLKILKWIDKEPAGEGFARWKRVTHPQLGEVEVGGIDFKFVRQNPPPRLLHQECQKNTLFVLGLMASMPKIEVESVSLRDLGNGVFNATVVVSNTGYMPTSATQQALASKYTRPVEVSLAIPEGGVLLSSKAVQSLDHLPGRAAAPGSASATGSRRRVTWLVDLSGAKGAKTLTVKVDGGRGGIVTKEIVAGA